MFTRRIPLLFALAIGIAPAVSFAQQRDSQARANVRQAMEDYQNLDIDGALNRLRLTINMCGRTNCTPPTLARVHMAVGIVAVGGQNDATLGTNEFTEALRLDPNSAPDPLLTTPEINAAFTQAQSRAGSSGGGGASTTTGGGGRTPAGGGRTPAGGGTDTGGGAAAGGGGGGAARGTLLHTAWSEQLENTPLPVFAEAQGMRPEHVTLHYRGLGMSAFANLEMTRVANGHGIEIPCGQVIQPHVDYYITATDATGNVIGTSGTPETPLRVPIVRARTQPAPALPGRMPPEACGEDCPPGMTGPQCRGHGAGAGGGGGGSAASSRGSRQLGDPCESNNQCAEGMHCEGGACASGDAGGSGGPPSESYRLAVDLGGGAGLAWLSGTPNYIEFQDYTPDDIDNPTCGYPRDDQDPASLGRLVCPRTISPGFTGAGIFYFGVRINLISRIAVGLSLRFQPDAARNCSAETAASGNSACIPPNVRMTSASALANIVFGVRVYVNLLSDTWRRTGLNAAAFVGGGAGQIHARPGLSSGTAEVAHVISGNGNVNLGLHVEYGLMKNIHAGITLTGQFMVPTFLFALDAQAVVGVHF